MTQNIEDVCSAVVVILKTVTALKQVPIDPPDTVNVDTFAVVYAGSGMITNGVVGTKKSLHNIVIDALTKRTDLARDLARVKPLIDLIKTPLLADPTLGGTAQTFESISYELVNTDYASVPVIGYKFTLNNVKILAD